MNTLRLRVASSFAIGLLLLACPVLGQTVSPAVSPPGEEEVIRLSPFAVNVESDTGYQATQTMAGGRMNTELGSLASSVSVLTRDFIDDIAATDLFSAAYFLPNAEPQNRGSQTMNDYSVSIRGFASGQLYRNYFISYVNPDSYLIERVESARGPNALVFGDTKAGGTINLNPKQAKFRNFGAVTYRYNDTGGNGRATLDVNRKLTETVAIRFAALYQNEDEWVDFSYTDRRGLYGAVTWQPFSKTTVRFDVESYTQNLSNRFFGATLRDNYANWNGTTSYTAPNQPVVAGSGTSALAANYWVYAPGSSANLINWTGFRQTNGSGYQMDVYAPAYQIPSFPSLPYRGYNIRAGKGHDIELTHDVSTLAVQQQVGDSLFLEVAANYAQQNRHQRQLATEGVFIDINRNLPDGTVNPNFGKRYTESGQYSNTIQENTLKEARITAAYLTKLGDWSEHRLLLGGAFRNDAYRSHDRQFMRDVAGARFGNPFQNVNSFRLRIYEDQRGIEDSLPAGIKVGRWTSFPGEDKDLASGQFAASSKWFSDGRLSSLIGVRQDKLRTKGVTGNADPVTGELVSFNERLPGRDFEAIVTKNVGVVYRIASWISPYASYSEGYDTSNVGLMLTPATGVADVPLPAKDSKGYEAGIKFSAWDSRITGSVAYYQNEQTNDNNTGVNIGTLRTNVNNLWNVIDTTKQIPANWSDVINYEGDGLELELIANPTKNWRMSFNLSFPETERLGGLLRTRAYVDLNRPLWQSTLNTLVATNDARTTAFRNSLEAVDALIAGAANGRPLIGTVDYSANFFTTYNLTQGRLNGFRIGGGANIRGERYTAYQQRVPGNANVGTLTPIYSKGYDVYTALIGYRTKIAGKRVDFQLNVENLFDEYYKRYTNYNSVLLPDGNYVINGNNYVFNGIPRRFLLTATVNF